MVCRRALLVLIALVLFGPRTWPGLPAWPASVERFFTVFGLALIAAGVGLLGAAGLKLGSALTPLPYPRASARLAQSGPYRIVRHPMYAGALLASYGWALFVEGWLTLFYATIVLVFLDCKSSREERWLVQKYPDYPDYQRRVRKLIPFVY